MRPVRRPKRRKYGGNLEIGSMYPTISALSWDLADWNWKQNYDTGQVYEQLFVADLSKSRRNGGKYAFQADAWLPEDAIRGELAEKLEVGRSADAGSRGCARASSFPPRPA
ncbi:hypothetical protein ACU4GD_04905 [Cupriavidus basilensis]